MASEQRNGQDSAVYRVVYRLRRRELLSRYYSCSYYREAMINWFSIVVYLILLGLSRNFAFDARFNWKSGFKSIVKFTQTAFLSSFLYLQPFQNIYPIESSLAAEIVQGRITVEPEVMQVFRKASQLETSGNFEDAQAAYEDILEATPDFILGWANLGNVLTAEGDLKNAILCYKKAISLRPPRETLINIMLNKGVNEMNLGSNEQALRDIRLAEKLNNGLNQNIMVNEAVALSRTGSYQDAVNLLDKAINAADRNALPWWLRYSVSLLEVGRGTESAAFVQRVLNRFPDEAEPNAFATSLYYQLGNAVDAREYWKQLSVDNQGKYSDPVFLEKTLYWGPKAIDGLVRFLKTNR